MSVGANMPTAQRPVSVLADTPTVRRARTRDVTSILRSCADMLEADGHLDAAAQTREIARDVNEIERRGS